MIDEGKVKDINHVKETPTADMLKQVLFLISGLTNPMAAVPYMTVVDTSEQ